MSSFLSVMNLIFIVILNLSKFLLKNFYNIKIKICFKKSLSLRTIRTIWKICDENLFT